MESDKSPDSSWNLLYRLGAISAFAYILMILVPLVLLIVAPQAPTSGGAAILEYIVAHRAVYLAELVCFVGLSLPAIAVFLALGVALAPVGKSLAALGTAIGLGSELIALALGSSPPSLGGGLMLLAARYATAAEPARASLAAAADGLAASANAVSAAGILTALGILILSLLIGIAYGVYGLLLPLWFLAAGLGLLRHSRGSSAVPNDRRAPGALAGGSAKR